MVKIEILTKHQKSDVQALNLNTSHSDKIHRIESLDRFRQLRSLNLSNNMIDRIENLSHLANLKVLNLDFNQITIINNLQNLTKLEELSLSYNCIQQVPDDISYNIKLKVFHLAYNDLKSLETIKSISSLPSLSVLSLSGNPFLTALSYMSFLKMLVPSLIILDSKDVNQTVTSSCVQPYQEIFILRDALNKLIDERNSMMEHQASGLQQSPIHERQQNLQQRVPEEQEMHGQLLMHKHSFGRPPSLVKENQKTKVTNMIEEWLEGYQSRLEMKKIEIGDLSEQYSMKLAANSMNQFSIINQTLYEKIKKYKNKDDRGLLSSEKKQKLAQMQKQIQKQENVEGQKRQQSRLTLNMLKAKEAEYQKLRERITILKKLKTVINQNPPEYIYSIIASQVLYGQSTPDLNIKSLKKILFYPKGLLNILSLLNTIIFGEAADYERIYRLKEFLQNKSLIEIINNLKEMGLSYQKEKKKYLKERNKLIAKMQTQAQQLCHQWKELEREKWMLKKSRKLEEYHSQTPPSFNQNTQYEEQQRTRILVLRKEKQHYENRVEELKKNHENLSMEFERKYRELQQFQFFFQEFKKDRQIVSGMKQEKQDLQSQIKTKQSLLFQIQQNIKDLKQRQEILQEKFSNCQRKTFQKSQQLKLYQDKLRVVHEKLKKINEQVNMKSYQYLNLQQNYTMSLNQFRQFQKKIERCKNTLELYEDKLSNLNKIQINKQTQIKNLETELEKQLQRYSNLMEKSNQVEEKLNRNMEISYQYQLKIQEGKKNIQSLADINRTLADMMERQNQLKRSNFELQLENQQLLELKGKLLDHVKIKYDDQDDNL